ncbi:hypothetical protein OF83DRAFT_350435 [Amylostereum chailletii]|nr:hypothetical protein OF83DRAFT_350435 [Amylostereum chailletii]
MDHTLKSQETASPSPTKRAKGNEVVDNLSVDSIKKTGKSRDLSLMSLDVLMEIFDIPDPWDLYHLSLVNKRFHQFFSSPASNGVWRSAFERCSDSEEPWLTPPPRPSGISYLGWSHIIFSRGICNCCGGPTSSRYIFEFRKRVCHKCAGARYSSIVWSVIEVPTRFKCVSDRLPPPTEFLPTIENPTTYEWLGTVVCEKIALKRFFVELEERCDAAGITDGDVNRLNDEVAGLVSRKRAALNEQQEHLKLCNAWETAYRQFLVDQRIFRVRERFFALGFARIDVPKWIFYHESVHTEEHLTDDEWDSILPELLPSVERRREERLHVQWCNRFNQRCAVVSDLCVEVLRRKVSPMEMSFMPNKHSLKIWRVEELLSMDVPSDDVWCTSVTKALETMVEDVRKTVSSQTERIAGLLPPLDRGPSSESSSDMSSTSSLALALSVFENPYLNCYSPRAFFGIEAIVQESAAYFFSEPNVPQKIKFSARGRMIVHALLDLLGLSETTTTQHMDNLATTRFACELCLKTPGTAVHALKWREMVNHVLQNHAKEENVDFIRAVVEDELARVLKWEDCRTSSTGLYWDISWSCCHCLAFRKGYGVWMSEIDVVEHAKLEHQITHPVENVDIFFNLRVDRGSERLKMYRLDSSVEKQIEMEQLSR